MGRPGFVQLDFQYSPSCEKQTASDKDLTKIEEDHPREFYRLVLVDFITNQNDRHRQNIFTDTQGKSFELVGIDSDFSFGPSLTKADHTRGIPTKLDANVIEKLKSLEKSSVNASLPGLLTSAEIEATWKRIEQARAAIKDPAFQVLPK